MNRLLATRLAAVMAVGACTVALAHPPPGVPSASPTSPPPPPSVGGARLDELQGQLALARLDGWLLCDDGATDPRAAELVRPAAAVTRRWFYFIPVSGDPVAVIAQQDAGAFDAVPGKRVLYRSWRELETGLKGLLKGKKRVAMAYSPRGAVPQRGRVDAGTVDLVRSQGVVVLPDGELLAHVETRWGDVERTSHQVAARQLAALKDHAVRFIAERLRAGKRVGEYELAHELWRALPSLGLESEALPVVAAGVNTGDPAYLPDAKRWVDVRAGDLVLLRLAARQMGVPQAAYAELVWMGYVGEVVPERAQALWNAVREARDKAVGLLQERRAKQSPVVAHEVDTVIRGVLDKAGLGDKCPAPTGRSLGRRLRIGGPLLDDLDTHDERLLLPRSGVVVAPGVHFAGELGVATSATVYLGDKAAELTGEAPQAAIEPIRLQ